MCRLIVLPAVFKAFGPFFVSVFLRSPVTVLKILGAMRVDSEPPYEQKAHCQNVVSPKL